MNIVSLCQYKPAGTKSFRLSSTKLRGKFGVNMQNGDKDSLHMYVPRKGMVFVQADQAGAEALIVGHMARDGRMRQLFKNGIKPHSYLAGHIFSDRFKQFQKEWFMIDPAKLAKEPDWKDVAKRIKNSAYEYDLGKRTCHARNYKMGWGTFRDNVLKETKGQTALTVAESKLFLSTFDDLFPEVLELHAVIEEKILKGRCLRNLLGYERRFEQKITDSYMREAISWVPQSTVGCITHIAVINTQDKIESEGLDWNILSNKHDSMMAEVPETEAMEAAKYLNGQLKQKLVGWDGEEFTMGSEVSIGYNWGKWSESNPNGMKEVNV